MTCTKCSTWKLKKAQNDEKKKSSFNSISMHPDVMIQFSWLYTSNLNFDRKNDK